MYQSPQQITDTLHRSMKYTYKLSMHIQKRQPAAMQSYYKQHEQQQKITQINAGAKQTFEQTVYFTYFLAQVVFNPEYSSGYILF